MWSREGPCYIIAEAGSNHDGDLEQARALIDVAAQAGVNAVKFQCIDPLRKEWLPDLKKHTVAWGMEFLATPFDVDAVKLLDELNVAAIKIASPELVRENLLTAAARTKRPLILSTGMATMGNIERALEVTGFRTEHVALLQCTTRYPTPYEQANLYAMDTLRDAFGVTVGLSDHTLGTAVPIAAAALRASIIEKHFTLDRGLKGPDHSYALEPEELKAMVQGIRQVEVALGDGHKGPQKGELIEARGRTIQWT
jgi:N-acetylneuraminate synthase/N,N'-diacetyllegionaminate synthase